MRRVVGGLAGEDAFSSAIYQGVLHTLDCCSKEKFSRRDVLSRLCL
jgi:hypothetical protein